MNIYTKITALATTILLSLAFIAPANASEPPKAERAFSVTDLPAEKISVPTNASISFERSEVSSSPAPVAPVQEIVAPREQVQVQSQTYNRTPQATTPVQPYKAPVTASPQFSAPSGVGAALVASAYAQIGIHQDCTAMVEHALEIGRAHV